MGRHARILSVITMMLLAGCSANTAPAPEEPAQTAAQPSEADLMALLPDQATAECTGSLEFVSQRRVEGRSRCSGSFSGSADGSLSTGTLCVYSTKVETRTAVEITAAGHFVCSDGNHGVVQFKEKRGKAEGVATATAADGRVVTITYR